MNLNTSETLGQVIDGSAVAVPTRRALCDGFGNDFTWEQLADASARLAGWLASQGVDRGSRVLLLAGDRAEQVVAEIAVVRLGCVAVPINHRLKGPELAAICDEVEPAAVVFADEHAELAGASFDRLSGPKIRIAVGSEQPGTVGWDEATSHPNRIWDEAQADDVALLGFTSGTTGKPKVIELDHKTVRDGAQRAVLAYGLPVFGTSVQSGSMSFFAVNITHLWSHLWTRSTVIILGAYDVKRQWELVAKHRATFTYVPTPALRESAELLRAEPKLASSLRALNIGGSTMPQEDVRALVDAAGSCVVATYGLSEATGAPLCRAGVAEWEAAAEGYASAGLPVPPVVLEIVGVDGNPLPHDGESVGELLALTSTVLRVQDGDPRKVGGWLNTGDLASIDANGYVSIRGRSRDVVISGGINVYPADVETVLASVPGVAECAVTGRPHERWGETVVAYVSVDSSCEPADVRREIDATVRHQLASFKRPTTIYVVDQLPRNTSGKIVKGQLGDQQLIQVWQADHEVKSAGPLTEGTKMTGESR